MRALQLLSLLGNSLALHSHRTDRVPEPRLLAPLKRRRKRYTRSRDLGRVVRVAGPDGFRWHVKRDGLTVSSHATQAEAVAALGGKR